MKVLWFCNTPASGAEYLGIKDIRGGWLKSLDKLLGHHVNLHVVFEYPKKSFEFEYNGISYYPICPSSNLIAIFKIVKNLFYQEFIDDQLKEKYLKVIQKVKPDIIHIHGTENSFSVILKSNLRIPIVVSIQGNSIVYNYKYFHGLPKELSNKLNYSSFFSFLTTKSYGNIYKISQKSASREQKYIELHKNIIGRTDWDRRITSILSPGRSYFHNDEVLRDSFYEKQWRPKRDLDLVIIHSTIGSNYFKGLESILLASYLLTKYGLKHQWKVAGVVKNDLIVKISKKYLNIPSIDRSIIYLGNISELDLVENLLNSHIYVMPSHIENSPNNLCEAMILGMPCISTNAGGSSSLITDKVDGLLIQNGDPWSMAGAIVEFCEDFDKAIDYGKKARIRALQRHSKEKIVRDLLEIYKNCLKQ